VHIALNGLAQSHPNLDSFPYEATDPLSNKKVMFDEIEDVYKLLVECYDQCNKEGFKSMGNALYEYSRFFVNDKMIVDEKIQNTIKSYRYCKKFNCPPFPSLNETPVDIIDSFMIIDDEITQHQSRKQNG
jgi:hypothetical protein